MDTPLPQQDDLDEAHDPPTLSESDIRASLEESRRDIAAGRIVPGEDVLHALQQAIIRIEARRSARLA